MNDLHTLRNEENDSLVRLLFQRVCGVCSGASDFSQTVESGTGSAPIRTDAAGQADTGSDIKRGKK